MQSPENFSDLAPPEPDEETVVLLIPPDDGVHRSRVAAAAEEAATPTFKCSVCGYGVARSTPPERCPMCHNEGAWVDTSRRPFAHA
jgi:rubrerythrin